MAEKNLRKLYKSEKILYTVFGAIWIAGFVLAILGVFAYNYGKLANNPLYTFQKNLATFFGMSGKVIDLRLWGTIIMVIAMIAFLIAIYAFTAKNNNAIAAERRRQERLKILMEDDDTKAVVKEEEPKEEVK